MIDFRATRWQQRDLAERLCQLLYGKSDVRWDDRSQKWHLGNANNFWLHILGPDTYRLSCRYGTPEQRKALAVVVEWCVGVEVLG